MRCAECNENLFRESQGETVCINCGLVIEDNKVDENVIIPQGRFAAHPAIAQAGTFNTNGRKVKESWLLSTKQKNYRAMCNEIDLLTSRIKAQKNIAEHAKRMLLEASHQDLAVGKGNLILAYACVYLACIDAAVPQTALEITAHTEVSKHSLLAGAKFLQRRLKLPSGVIEAIDLIPRFATRLQLSNQTVTVALDCATRNRALPVQPSTLAAVSLYAASKETGEHRVQRLFTRYTGVMEVTLRQRSKQLLKKRSF